MILWSTWWLFTNSHLCISLAGLEKKRKSESKQKFELECEFELKQKSKLI